MSLAPAPTPTTEMVLRTTDGQCIPLDVQKWMADPCADELAVLGDVEGPVLDIGCGPGRHAHALASRGVMALGIDASPAAIAAARKRGAPVIERSVFDRVPASGRWATALLLDGNVGIGGDPAGLLRRSAELLRADGSVVVEIDPSVTGVEHLQARLEAAGSEGPWFPWARVGFDGLGDLAAESGFFIRRIVELGGRWFAWLVKT